MKRTSYKASHFAVFFIKVKLCSKYFARICFFTRYYGTVEVNVKVTEQFECVILVQLSKCCN
jgi:hypothetical protein